MAYFLHPVTLGTILSNASSVPIPQTIFTMQLYLSRIVGTHPASLPHHCAAAPIRCTIMVKRYVSSESINSAFPVESIACNLGTRLALSIVL